MDGSSRASAPPQLTLVPVRAPTSPVAGTPQSADSMVRSPSTPPGNNLTGLTPRQTSGPFSASEISHYTYSSTSPTYGTSSPTYASGYSSSYPNPGYPSTYNPSTYSGYTATPYTSASRTSSTSTAAPLLGTSSSNRMGHAQASSAACVAAPRTAVAPKKVNANSYCGRHSDEFLFGGKGLGDLWRAVVKK